MAKRIFAWILLIGFVLLFINLLFIGYQRSLSGLLYIILVIFFLFTQKKAGER